MSILSAQTLRNLRVGSKMVHIVEPFVERSKHEETNTSFGLSMSGYDIRLDQDIILGPSGQVDSFTLASTIEQFTMPTDVLGIVHDKSTWARRGLSVFNTVIEPGWYGFLTLELVNNGQNILRMVRGTPIAQVVFSFLDQATDTPYGDSKYQGQLRGPQEAR